MAGKGMSTSESPNPSVAVCCMCGDHGLPQELLRCKGCIFRSQHKYCSYLYPKEEEYEVCNRCLRKNGGISLACEDNIFVSSPSSNGVSDMGGLVGLKLDHRTYSSQLDKPIKKQRLPKRPSSDVSARIRSEVLLLGASLGARQAFGRKAMRYKLLKEVSLQ